MAVLSKCAPMLRPVQIDDEGTITFLRCRSCAVCGGPYHPASGHAWPSDVVICGPCTRAFFAWVRMHCRPRDGLDFYAEAATSVRAA